MFNRKKLKETGKAYLGAAPIILVVFVVCLIPILYNIYLSFTNYSLYRYTDYDFIGLKNYQHIHETSVENFWGIILWTLGYGVSVQTLGFLLGAFLAVLLNKRNIRLRRVYRSLLIIPWAMPAFITILMWKGLLNYNFGAINALLKLWNMKPIPWLTEPNWARLSVTMVSIWYTFPFLMVISLGVLQSIPGEIYEAAAIDGSSTSYSFKKITLPMLLKNMIPVLLLGLVMNFNNFGVYLLTEGGPVSGSIKNPGATDLLITYIFKLAFKTQRYGLASAYSVTIFIIMGAFTLMNMRIPKKISALDD